MPRLADKHRPSVGRRSRSLPLLDLLARARSSFAARSWVIRELVLLCLSLLVGVILVPLAIWFVGNRVLGPYTHGSNAHAGPLALLGDFFVGLGSGWVSYWMVALGPTVIILFVRAAWSALSNKSNGESPPPKRRIEPTVAKDRL
jgi:hypothetical protein